MSGRFRITMDLTRILERALRYPVCQDRVDGIWVRGHSGMELQVCDRAPLNIEDVSAWMLRGVQDFNRSVDLWRGEFGVCL